MAEHINTISSWTNRSPLFLRGKLRDGGHQHVSKSWSHCSSYTSINSFHLGWLAVVKRHVQRYFSYIHVVTAAQFPYLGLLPGTTPSIPWHEHRDVLRLPSEGPNAVEVYRESSPDLAIHNLARNLYETSTGVSILETQTN